MCKYKHKHAHINDTDKYKYISMKIQMGDIHEYMYTWNPLDLLIMSYLYYLNFRIVQCSMYITSIYYIYNTSISVYLCVAYLHIYDLDLCSHPLGQEGKQSMHSEWPSLLLPQTIQNWNPVSGPKAISRGPRPQDVEAANRMLGKARSSG